MAAPLTDLQKMKLVADYARLGNYAAVARENGVSNDTVRRAVKACDNFAELAAQKKEENTQDIISDMESQRDTVNQTIGLGLKVLLDEEKLRGATPSQLTTMIGTLVDKWAAIGGGDTASLAKAREILGGVESAID